MSRKVEVDVDSLISIFKEMMSRQNTMEKQINALEKKLSELEELVNSSMKASIRSSKLVRILGD